ncbi:MAG: hypothetical protein K5745_02375 [Saccharofermentans sp.]|nr:hypothetical protein [Saccharofermentans sp.]
MDFETWKDEMEYFLDEDNTYSEEDLYKSYLDMCYRFLNELATSANYEKYILDNSPSLEDSEHLIEKIATSDPSLLNLDAANLDETDRKERIKNLIAHIECTLGI